MKQNLLIVLILFILSIPVLMAQSQPEQVNLEYKISIPNPISDQVVIRVSQGKFNLTEIRIFDIIGKEVITLKLNNGNGPYPLDMSGFRAGVYFCTIYSDKGVVETRKLIKNY